MKKALLSVLTFITISITFLGLVCYVEWTTDVIDMMKTWNPVDRGFYAIINLVIGVFISYVVWVDL